MSLFRCHLIFLIKNIRIINFENELKIDLQAVLSHAMETLHGLPEIASRMPV